MHQKSPQRLFGKCARPIQQTVSVRVPRKPCQSRNLCVNLIGFPENVDFLLPILQFTAKRVDGLIASQQNCAAGVFDMMFKVMLYAPGFGHAAGTDNHSRIAQKVKLLTLIHGTHVMQTVKAEWIMMLFVAL